MKWSREDYTGSAVETAKHLIGAVRCMRRKKELRQEELPNVKRMEDSTGENQMTAPIPTRGLRQGHKLFLEKAGIFMYI